MANALVKQEQPQAMAAIEQVLVGGDLSPLNPSQRVQYYNRVCESVGLNPLTRPFDYIKLNGKLVLYARRDAADQLRSIHGISLSKPGIEYADDLVIVSVDAVDKTGRTDSDFGAVSIKGLSGENKANALLKAVTKAKRRVTLSICGLGWLDETEVDSIPDAQRVAVDAETGEIVDGGAIASPVPSVQAQNGNGMSSYAHLIDKLTGDCLERANRARGFHANGRGPATPEQYRYLSGVIDELVGVQKAHNAILEVFVGRAVNGENPPSILLASKLLDALVKEKPEEVDGQRVMVPNPAYSIAAVNCVHTVFRLVQEANGQQSLFDTATQPESVAA